MNCLLRCTAVGLMLVSSAASANPDKLAAALESTMEEVSEHTGFSLHVIEGDTSYSLVEGMAAPDTMLVPAHMFRIASITKSYTAAAVLRLVEQGKLDLSQSLAELIPPSYDTLLRSDGYDTDTITLRQVLNHTAGLFDHAQSPSFINAILETPDKVWTRSEQIEALVAWGDPVGAPGEKYVYSDTGYILLGDIIERTTGSALPLAVRELLKFDTLGLRETVWERGDSVPVSHSMRAHQFLMGNDTYDWDPSIDLYGGGGLVATPRDVARFYNVLMSGKIFDTPQTLALMLSADGTPESSPYRLGIFERGIDGSPVYEHGGFWGTSVFHDPATGITVAGAALKQKDYERLVETIRRFLKSKRQ